MVYHSRTTQIRILPGTDFPFFFFFLFSEMKILKGMYCFFFFPSYLVMIVVRLELILRGQVCLLAISPSGRRQSVVY